MNFGLNFQKKNALSILIQISAIKIDTTVIKNFQTIKNNYNLNTTAKKFQ